MTTLPKLRGVFADMGRLDGSLYVASRAMAALSGGRARLLKYYVVAQPVGTAPRLRPDTKTQIMPTRPGDPLLAHFPRPQGVIKQRFADGAQCLTATVNGELEARCLFVMTEPERSAWDFDVHVEPRYRLGRTLARLWLAAHDLLQAQGVEWTYSRISAFNTASLAAHTRLGARTIAGLVFLQLGGWQVSWLPRPPRIHLSRHAGQRPEWALTPPAHA